MSKSQELVFTGKHYILALLSAAVVLPVIVLPVIQLANLKEKLLGMSDDAIAAELKSSNSASDYFLHTLLSGLACYFFLLGVKYFVNSLKSNDNQKFSFTGKVSDQWKLILIAIAPSVLAQTSLIQGSIFALLLWGVQIYINFYVTKQIASLINIDESACNYNLSFKQYILLHLKAIAFAITVVLIPKAVEVFFREILIEPISNEKFKLSLESKYLSSLWLIFRFALLAWSFVGMPFIDWFLAVWLLKRTKLQQLDQN